MDLRLSSSRRNAITPGPLAFRPFLCVVLLLLCLGSLLRAQPIDLPPATAKEVRQGYRDDLVLAMPLAHVAGTIAAAEVQEGTRVRRKFPRFGGLRAVAVNAGETADQAIARLKATGRYEFVERDSLRFATATPNDPGYASQWALNNSGNNPQVTGPEIAGADIHAETAWNTRTDASSVIVAVIDSGARLTHTDLVGNLWTNPTVNTDGYLNDYHGINTTSTTNNGDPTDDDGHGTHVSGIIGAIGNNGVGVAGVAWKVQLMELKFLDATGSGDMANAVVCMDFAISHGANIINASYGGRIYSSSELAAIKAAARAGIIVVCSAGNTPTDNSLSPNYPADYLSDNIVAVAASDNRDDLTFFTNYGSGNVDLVAPGYQILSLSYQSNTGTTVMSGTSMAAPMVTGSLALLRAQYPNDTYRQLINRILSTVDVRPTLVGRVQTGGRLNLAAALTSSSNTPFNDSFASRAHLLGANLTVRSSSVGASRESGEPAIRGDSGGASLWWDWTAPFSGTVTLSSSGSSFSSLLGVYTGTSLASLSPVASSASASGSTANQLSFQATAGTTYQITIDGRSGASGFAVLSLGYINDAFASALALAGRSASLADSNLNASAEFGEPTVTSGTGRHTLWYKWTAPYSGPAHASVTSYDFDPVLGVYTGSSVSSLARVASASGTAIDTSAATAVSVASAAFTATQGTTYYFQVDGTTETSTELNQGEYVFSLDDSLWQYSTGDSVTCSPVVGPDGSVYVGSDDNNFYAFKPDGSLRWKYTAGGYFDTNTAAIGPDGTIYAACSDGKLYAFSSAGSVLWTYVVPTPTDSTLSKSLACSPALASDGTLYVKADDNKLYAITPTGALKWTATVPGTSYASPTIAPDGTIYLGSDSGTFYALKSDGSTRWTYTADNAIYTAAAIDGSGNVYFGTLTGMFYSLTSSGSLRWSHQAGNCISSSPAIATDGTVYFGSYDHNLYALNGATGQPKWTFRMGHEVRASSPAIDANGVVYIGNYDGSLYAVNPDGTLNRTFASGDWIRSSPVLWGTRLFFGGNDHQVYAFDIGTTSAASPWPMFQYGPQRPGRATAEIALPVVTTQPLAQSLAAGSTLSLTVAATGTGLSYQWYRDGTALSATDNPSAATASLSIRFAAASDNGSYTCVVANASGSVTSSAAAVVVAAAPSTVNDAQLIDISGRTFVGTGESVQVAGFYISGTQPKKVLIRASGPALSKFNLTGFLPDPTLQLFDTSGKVLTQNTGWSTSADAAAIKTTAAALHAFTWDDNSKDSALLLTLPPGGYTAQVSGASGDTGTALVEVYDADSPTTSPRLIDISLRTFVGTGSNVQVGGFIITGSKPKTVLIRASGPALAAFGLTTYLPDPVLQLFDGNSLLVRQNSGWSTDAAAAASIKATAARLSAFAWTDGSKDAALLVTLPPGAYTAQVSGASGDTGTALLEIYDADTQ